MTTLACPIEPHELPKKMRLGLEDIAARVVAAAAVRGRGNDIMLRVYLAGIHHGVELSKDTPHG